MVQCFFMSVALEATEACLERNICLISQDSRNGFYSFVNSSFIFLSELKQIPGAGTSGSHCFHRDVIDEDAILIIITVANETNSYIACIHHSDIVNDAFLVDTVSEFGYVAGRSRHCIRPGVFEGEILTILGDVEVEFL